MDRKREKEKKRGKSCKKVPSFLCKVLHLTSSVVSVTTFLLRLEFQLRTQQHNRRKGLSFFLCMGDSGAGSPVAGCLRERERESSFTSPPIDFSCSSLSLSLSVCNRHSKARQREREREREDCKSPTVAEKRREPHSIDPSISHPAGMAF